MNGVKILAEKNKGKFLMYKGRPLVRKGNTLYYGNMYDPYVVMLTVTNTKKEKGMDIADKVTVQLMSTDLSTNPEEIILKTSEKSGLYAAMDIGTIWLERALKSEKD